MKLSRELKWLDPYLESVSHLVVLSRIKAIDYYLVRKKTKSQGHQAITHRLNNNKDFKIFIQTKLKKENRLPLMKDDQENVLFCLAHELAHIPFWTHGREHFGLMAEIFYEFGKVLESLDFEVERNRC